jgi:signal transduction histidine kinase
MAGLIIDGTKALERLVTGVLQYARPIQIRPKSTEIGQFLRQLVRFIRVDPACPKGIRWDLHILDDILVAPIDGDALKSALLNLIFNAFHAMPISGVITLSLLKGESCYQIAISDTGIGMDDAQLTRIFSPFFTTKDQGNGLGLVEVQKIVQAHYGTIDVRSCVGKGTTFTLAFPLLRQKQ